MIIVTVKFYNIGVIYLCIMCILAGIGEYLIAFANDFEHNLKLIDAHIAQYNKSNDLTSDKLRLQLKSMFRDLIQFHCDLRQLWQIHDFE